MKWNYRFKESATDRFPLFLEEPTSSKVNSVGTMQGRKPLMAVSCRFSCDWEDHLPSQTWGSCFLSGARSMRRVFLSVGVCVVGGAQVQAQTLPRFQPQLKQLDIYPVRTGNQIPCILWISSLLREDGVMGKGIRWSVCSSAQRISCSFLHKMTTPSTLPVKDQDCVELRRTGDHVFDGGSALFG